MISAVAMDRVNSNLMPPMRNCAGGGNMALHNYGGGARHH